MQELGIAEAAAVLGVSVDSVRRRIKRGDLQARKDSQGRLLVTLPDSAQTGESLEESRGVELARAEMEHVKELLAETRRRAEVLEKQLESAQQTQRRDAEEREQLRTLLQNAQKQVLMLLPAPQGIAEQDAQQPASTPPATARNGVPWWIWLPLVVGIVAIVAVVIIGGLWIAGAITIGGTGH